MIPAAKWINKFLLKPNRWVFIPSLNSKLIGKDICLLLTKKWKAPEYFYHLRNGGHVQAVRLHQKNNFFSKIDIDNFFGSITRSRITRSLKPLIGYKKAWEIAQDSTVKIPDSFPVAHMLPFGFIQSTLLASICLDKSSLGESIRELSKDSRLSISIYVDDIVISSNDFELLTKATTAIKDALLRSHWTSSAEKEDICKSSITAFNINLSYQAINITEKRLQLFKNSFISTVNPNKKLGIIKYIFSVNKGQGSNFLQSK